MIGLCGKSISIWMLLWVSHMWRIGYWWRHVCEY